MPKPQSRVLFISGLNTYGDQFLHLGPVRFRPMYFHLKKALEPHLEFHSLPHLGSDQIESMIARALTEVSSQVTGPVHLLAHSTGGLVARALACELGPKKIQSVMTIGTPHRGSPWANLATNLSRRSQKILGGLGYSLTRRLPILSQLTPQSLVEFNKKYPLPSDVYHAYVLADAPSLSLPLIALRKAVAVAEPPLAQSLIFKGDGFVATTSQAWGNELGTVAMDHLQELGFNFNFSNGRFKIEFKSLIDLLTKHFDSRQNLGPGSSDI